MSTEEGYHFAEVPVIEVNADNFESLIVKFHNVLAKADLIALDMEFTGIGEARNIRAKESMQIRYKIIKDVVEARSVLSFGIALFQKRQNDDDKCLTYKCHVFNFNMLSDKPFTLDPEALTVLAANGFDFTSHHKRANQYTPAHLASSTKKEHNFALKDLVTAVMRRGVPVAVHNGLIDVMFILSHFIGKLPEDVNQYMTNLSTLFNPNRPLYDTKMLCSEAEDASLSFLLYAYRRSQRENYSESKQNRVFLKIRHGKPPSLASSIKCIKTSLQTNFLTGQMDTSTERLQEILCPSYKKIGFCNSNECAKCHNIDALLDLQYIRQEKERKRRKRRYDALKGANGGGTEASEPCDQSAAPTTTVFDYSNELGSELHNAGMDAFMTGFTFLFMSRMDLLRGRANKLAVHANCFPLPANTQAKIEPKTGFLSHLIGLAPLKEASEDQSTDQS